MNGRLARVALPVTEGFASLWGRPIRSAFGLLGPMLAAATLLTVVGAAGSAAAGIDQRISDLSAVEVTTRPTEVHPTVTLDWHLDAAIERIDGVQRSAVAWLIPTERLASVSAIPHPHRDVLPDLELRAASPNFAALIGARLTGRSLNDHDEVTEARVALAGVAALRSLGIPAPDAIGRAVFVDGIPFTVVGTISDVTSHPEALSAVILPTSTATHLWGRPTPVNEPAILTRIRPGAGDVVARQIPIAVAPENPEGLVSVPPLEPTALRRSLLLDLNVLSRALMLLAVTVGAGMIVVSTLSGLRERRPEFALRRAIGARRSDVALQVTWESFALGLAGGSIGIALGIVFTAVLATARGWQAVMDPAAVLVAAAVALGLGAVTGALAAVTAARVDPAEAIRD